MGGLADVEQLAFEREHAEAISPQHTQPTHSERLGRVALPGKHRTQTHIHTHKQSISTIGAVTVYSVRMGFRVRMGVHLFSSVV